MGGVSLIAVPRPSGTPRLCNCGYGGRFVLRAPQWPPITDRMQEVEPGGAILLALVSLPSAGKEAEMRKSGRIRLICRRHHCVTRQTFPELTQRGRLSGTEQGMGLSWAASAFPFGEMTGGALSESLLPAPSISWFPVALIALPLSCRASWDL